MHYPKPPVAKQNKVPSNSQARLRPRGNSRILHSPGWNDSTRVWLEQLIRRGAGQGLPVVFDFDNTMISGDVSEATLAVLTNSGKLKTSRILQTFSPPFRADGQARRTLVNSVDLTAYYEAFLAPTAHGKNDPTPASNGYAWAVEVMEGLTPLEVVEATRAAFQISLPGRRTFIQVTPGKTAFPVPFFHPEMVELLAELIRNRFAIWIVSAGNVWSIRWMILRVLNPMLRKLGVAQGVRADQIIGVTTLLADRDDRLYKDTLLVQENAGYAALRPESLCAYRLTSRLQFPVPVYAGKVACLLDALPRAPYLCVGDAPGDHRMLVFSEHRLWIARLEKPDFQRATLRLMAQTGAKKWRIQATVASDPPGFVSKLEDLPRNRELPREVFQSVSLLARLEQ